MRTNLAKVLVFWFLFWTLMTIFFAIKDFGNLNSGFLTLNILSTLGQWYVWGAFLPLLIWIDKRFAAGRSFTRRLLFHLPASIFLTLVYLSVCFLFDSVLYQYLVNLYPTDVQYFMLPKPRLALNDLQWTIFSRSLSLGRGIVSAVGSFQWNILIYWLLIGGWLAYDYNRDSRDKQLKAAQLEKLLIETRLHALQAQLQPHFLFNALNTISAFVEVDPRGTRRMIEHLGDLLRFSLAHSEQQETTLAEELAALDHYLAIQRVRFADQIHIEINVEPQTLAAVVPSMILQPLVENAIRHGVDRRALPGVISITAFRKYNHLFLRVKDCGPGLPREWPTCEPSGLGIPNTRRRLEHLYPSAHQFELTNAPEGGTIAEISIPFRAELTKQRAGSNHGKKIPSAYRR